jgi:hypothetical protein
MDDKPRHSLFIYFIFLKHKRPNPNPQVKLIDRGLTHQLVLSPEPFFLRFKGPRQGAAIPLSHHPWDIHSDECFLFFGKVLPNFDWKNIISTYANGFSMEKMA